MKHILSFGGGVNSTALYFLLKEKGLPIDEVVFADTGNELPETYGVVEKMKAIEPSFIVVRSQLAPSLYDYCMAKHTVPSRLRRDCTAKFKVRPIRNYLRAKYGKEETFVVYIGIALEEFHRMRTSDVKYIQNVYPLVDNRIDRAGCVALLEKHNFGGVIKSGCFFCPFTKKTGWIELKLNHPELMEKALALERNCGNKKVTLGIRGEPTCNVFSSCWL